MNRYVRRGSKDIALLDESSGYPRLHYVFDVSGTGVRRNSRDPDLWQYNDDLKQPVSDALTAAYGISHERVSQQLADIAGTHPFYNVALDTALYSIAASSEQLKGCFVEGTLTFYLLIDIIELELTNCKLSYRKPLANATVRVRTLQRLQIF